MHDNARPQRDHLVDEFLESEDIGLINWPASSLDFNPVKHAWDALGRAIVTCNTLREPSMAKTALMNKWDQLTQELINSLTSSKKITVRRLVYQ
ncbi:DDE_3 domain-containing protein [Trichonephila clavipes]|nr:DDE_3 domain-containing protein [Trichonephila clavipes]